MSENTSHDKVIAKIQHFADSMAQRKLEKEALSITIGKCELQSEVRSEILIYEQIIDEYYAIFDDILYR